MRFSDLNVPEGVVIFLTFSASNAAGVVKAEVVAVSPEPKLIISPSILGPHLDSRKTAMPPQV